MKVRLDVGAALAAGALHELHNVLAVAGSSAFLAHQSLDDRAALEKHLARAARQIDVARDLLDRMLAVSRGAELERVATPAAEVIAAATRDLAAPEGVSLVVEVEPPGLTVLVDPVLAPRAVANLVANAYEAARGHGGCRVAVMARVASGGVELAVEDDGPGLTAEAATAGQTTKQGGFGLGLTVARAIVEAHGGELRVDAPPSGARVVLVFR